MCFVIFYSLFLVLSKTLYNIWNKNTIFREYLLLFCTKYYCNENRRCLLCQKKIIITTIIETIITTTTKTITTTIEIIIIKITTDSFLFTNLYLKNYFTFKIRCKIVFYMFYLNFYIFAP